MAGLCALCDERIGDDENTVVDGNAAVHARCAKVKRRLQPPLCTCGHKAHPNKECPVWWDSAHDGVRSCGCVNYKPKAA